MTAQLSIILSNTYTKTSLNSRLGRLKEFLEYQFYTPHENPNLFLLLNGFFNQRGLSRDEFNALVAWDYPFFNAFNKENFYSELKNLENEVHKLPEVTLFLPFSLTLYDAPKIGGWFRTNVSPEIIMDVKYDGSLIGGCAVAWKGVYHDFSLKYYLQKSKSAIKNVVEEYLKAPGETQIV